jgi:hypothetical protein
MPSYDFLNNDTGEVENYVMRIAELDEFKEKNPHLVRYFAPGDVPGLGDAARMSVPGTKKADSSFEKYVIDRIKATNPGNTMGGHKTTSGNKEW